MPSPTQWEDYWDSFPRKSGRDEFLRQVGKTVHGQPISAEQLELLVADIIQKLNIKASDQVLDLCCGNGLVTSFVAGKCKQIVGVDYSSFLLEIARENFSVPNVRYYCMSALDITPEKLHISAPFTKIYMYEALQSFTEEQLAPLIERLLALSNETPVILLASIPHQRKLGKFYNTPELQQTYRKNRRTGALGLGTWWKQSVIRQTCSLYNLRCEFLPQPEKLHTAHYRFDVRITRK